MAKTFYSPAQSALTSRPLLVLVLILLWLSVCFSQTTLPPAAEDALNKGILAAKVPDYPLAIRFFEEARKAAPEAPVIYFNLGLAESKIPGRELRAIAWFEAYLLANPNASNAAVVSGRVTELDVRNQSNLAGFLKTVQNGAVQMSGERQDYDLYFVAELWADSGDVTTANAVAGLIQDAYYKSLAEATIAVVQMRCDDKEGAQRTFASALSDAERTANPARKSQARAAIIEAQTKSNNADKKLSPLNGQSRVASAVTATDWIKILDVEPLNSAPLLDLGGYLKSLPASSEPQKVFESTRRTADVLVQARYLVQQMLLGRGPAQPPISAVEILVTKEGARIANLPMDGMPAGGGYYVGSKQFEVRHGRSLFSTKGTLTVSPDGVTFSEKDHPETPQVDLKCTDISDAKVPGGFYSARYLRIRVNDEDKHFMAANAGEAYNIIELIKHNCGLDQPKKP